MVARLTCHQCRNVIQLTSTIQCLPPGTIIANGVCTGTQSGFTSRHIDDWDCDGREVVNRTRCHCVDQEFSAMLQYKLGKAFLVRGLSLTGPALPIRMQVHSREYILRSYVLCAAAGVGTQDHLLQSFVVGVDNDGLVHIQAMMDWGLERDNSMSCASHQLNIFCHPGDLETALDDIFDDGPTLILRVYERIEPESKVVFQYLNLQ